MPQCTTPNNNKGEKRKGVRTVGGNQHCMIYRLPLGGEFQGGVADSA
jgi:hypothetical protein